MTGKVWISPQNRGGRVLVKISLLPEQSFKILLLIILFIFDQKDLTTGQFLRELRQICAISCNFCNCWQGRDRGRSVDNSKLLQSLTQLLKRSTKQVYGLGQPCSIYQYEILIVDISIYINISILIRKILKISI